MMGFGATRASIIDDPEVIGLRRRVRELEEELAAWRDGARLEHIEINDVWRLHIIKTELGVKPGAARLLLHLLDCSPAVQSRAGLHEALKRAGTSGRTENLVDTYLSYLRAALAEVGVATPFTNTLGVGWAISREAAARIRAALDLPAPTAKRPRLVDDREAL